MTSELKPCPFCGGEALADFSFCDNTDPFYSGSVECLGCGATGPYVSRMPDDGTPEKLMEASVKWNTRPSAEPVAFNAHCPSCDKLLTDSEWSLDEDRTDAYHINEECGCHEVNILPFPVYAHHDTKAVELLKRASFLMQTGGGTAGRDGDEMACIAAIESYLKELPHGN